MTNDEGRGRSPVHQSQYRRWIKRLGCLFVQAEMPAQSPRDYRKVINKTMVGMEKSIDAAVL